MDGTSGKRATGAVGSDVPPLTADKDAREMSAKPTDERPAQPAPDAAIRAATGNGNGDDAHPGGLQRRVHLDLLGDHRLGLGDQLRARAGAEDPDAA